MAKYASHIIPFNSDKTIKPSMIQICGMVYKGLTGQLAYKNKVWKCVINYSAHCLN